MLVRARRPRDRPARARLGVRPARARLGRRGVPGAGAARGGLPRSRAARHRLARPRPRAEARARRPAAAASRGCRARSTWRCGRGAARRLLAQSRYAALLVSLHGTSLYARVDPASHPAIVPTSTASARCRRRWRPAWTPAEVDRNRRLLRTWDRFSLALCLPTSRSRSTTSRRPARPRRCGWRRPAPMPWRSRRGRSLATRWRSRARRAACRGGSRARRSCTRRSRPRRGCRCAGRSCRGLEVAKGRDPRAIRGANCVLASNSDAKTQLGSRGGARHTLPVRQESRRGRERR